MSLVWRLDYDPRFARPGVWMLNALTSGIRARVPFASGEVVVDLELRWTRSRDEAPDAVFAYPRVNESWMTEPTATRGDRPIHFQLELRRAPPHVDALLRRL